jgi:Ca-activated chloride channel family protein
MNGTPIQQAHKAIRACLGALSDDDRFGLVVFDDQVEVFRPSILEGTKQNRDLAWRFLEGVDARGGTELAAGVLQAAKMLGKEGGDILVATDGQVFGTERILERVRTDVTRIHCLGIGSASQDRFLSLLARETGGVSRFVTPRERVDLPAVDLFASTCNPDPSRQDYRWRSKVSLELVWPQSRQGPSLPARPWWSLASATGPGRADCRSRGKETGSRKAMKYRSR